MGEKLGNIKNWTNLVEFLRNEEKKTKELLLDNEDQGVFYQKSKNFGQKYEPKYVDKLVKKKGFLFFYIKFNLKI